MLITFYIGWRATGCLFRMRLKRGNPMVVNIKNVLDGTWNLWRSTAHGESRVVDYDKMVFFLFYWRPFLLKGGLGKRRHLTAFYPFGKFFPPFATLLSCHNEFNDMSHLDQWRVPNLKMPSRSRPTFVKWKVESSRKKSTLIDFYRTFPNFWCRVEKSTFSRKVD